MGSRSRSRSRERQRRSRSRSPGGRSKPFKDERRHDRQQIKKEKSRSDFEDASSRRFKAEGNSRGFGKPIKDETNDSEDTEEAQKPSFELSGKLMEDTNVYNGVVIK